MLSLVGHPTAVNPDPDLRAYARKAGWPVRDFRTARKAAKVGVPAAAGTGVVVGAVAAVLATRRRRRPAPPPPPRPRRRLGRAAAAVGHQGLRQARRVRIGQRRALA